jgi:hypothetical protein
MKAIALPLYQPVIERILKRMGLERPPPKTLARRVVPHLAD